MTSGWKKASKRHPCSAGLRAAQPLLKQLILELFLRGALHWHGRAVGRVSGRWHSSCSTGKWLWRGHGKTAEQRNQSYSHALPWAVLTYLWLLLCYCSSVCRGVSIAFPRRHHRPAARGPGRRCTPPRQPLPSAEPWPQAHTTMSVPPHRHTAVPSPVRPCRAPWDMAGLSFGALCPGQAAEGPGARPCTAAAPLSRRDGASSDFRPMRTNKIRAGFRSFL